MQKRQQQLFTFKVDSKVSMLTCCCLERAANHSLLVRETEWLFPFASVVGLKQITQPQSYKQQLSTGHSQIPVKGQA